jgi:predicted nucleic acid-binding protein
MTLVVDASVAVKWVMPESGSTAAAALREDDSHLIAPAIVIAEIGNALWKKTSRGEIEKREAISAFHLAVSHFAELIPLDDLHQTAFELAIALRHPIYDCFYLALAERERCALVTADAKLVAAGKRAKGIELRAL